MGLLNQASAANRIIIEGRSVTYSKTKVQQTYSQTNLNVQTTYWFAWEYRRFCTLQYKYVGMSYEAAVSKQNQLIGMYKRNFRISDWNPTEGTFQDIDGGSSMMGTQVQVVKDVGHMYEVHVSVSEEDSRMRKEGTLSPESLFGAENARTYEV